MTEAYEEFTPSQEELLSQFVTNTKGSVFVLYNLPEVVKGALFSRYSRSNLGLRSLLLKEFLQNPEDSGVAKVLISSDQGHELLSAIKKAQNFYDRILDGYGDDSIGELGGAHLAVENISLLGAKVIEDSRIGGSPLEKSTRYIYFDQKVKGEYLFYKEPVLMTSAWRALYLNTCTMLFDTYSRLIPPLTAYMENKFPKDPNVSKNAYTATIRAKVLDCVRGLLPASTLTNIGLYGNGRFFESLLHRLHCHNLSEVQEIGKMAYDELEKVVPSFVRRAELKHKTHISFCAYQEAIRSELSSFKKGLPAQSPEKGIRLVQKDQDAVYKVAAALLYQESSAGFDALLAYCKGLPQEELERLFDAVATPRTSRRNKSPRALENAFFTFDLVADFGVYRDLQRHRILTQERQLLSCNLGYIVPKEITESGLEAEYRKALDAAKTAYDTIASELPEEAQYVVPQAYNVRWYFTINLRSLQWLTELRSQPAGHASYRQVAKEMAKEVQEAFPLFEKFLKFVDYSDGESGRLEQELRSEEKRKTV